MSSNSVTTNFENSFEDYCEHLYSVAYLDQFDEIQGDESIELEKLFPSVQEIFIQITQLEEASALKPEEEYVLKLRYCLFFQLMIKKHPDVETKTYSREINMIRANQLQYIKELDILRRTLKEQQMRLYNIRYKTKTTVEKNNSDQKKNSTIWELLFGTTNEQEQPKKPKRNSWKKKMIDEEEEEDGELEDIRDSPLVSSPAFNQVPADVFEKKLKKVYVNKRVIDEFLNFAYKHIAQKVEFCGLLFGKSFRDYYLVTQCVIPEQSGAEDCVFCTDEIALWKYKSRNHLINLGWIHTHPTQSAFLSSIDVYTQYGYQCGLSEFIAIVCAPRRKPNLGVFRIMDNKMEIVKQKTKTSKKFGKEFTKVSRKKVYEKCKHAVVSYDVEQKVEIIDLRKNKGVVLAYDDDDDDSYYDSYCSIQ